MAAPTTRWQMPLLLLLLLLLLLQGPGVSCQLSLGGANSFLPDHLDAAATAAATANAAAVTGNTLEVTPLADTSGTNAAVTAVVEATAAVAAAAATETASDPNSHVRESQADDLLTSSATDSPAEETTLPDFDDYAADETETTTETFSSENNISHTGEADHPDPSVYSRPIETTTDVPTLTRRIVFAGPDATVATSQPLDQSARPSSVVRGLDDPDTDIWLPNWPTQLLGSTEEPTRGPTIRFPSESPIATPDTAEASLATLTPLSTVSKVPVTQYYFDLASVSSTAIPGPLFDREDFGVSVSALPSVSPDVTHPLEPEDVPSTISDLQSSVLVDAAGPPVMSTPALPHSVTSALVASEGAQSISLYAVTQTLPPPSSSSSLNEVMGGHEEDNTLVEDAENGDDATINENTESPEAPPIGTGSTQSGLEGHHPDNTTASEDPGGLQSPTDTDEAPQPTSEPQPDLPSLTGPVLASDSEPLTTTTSSTTPGSVKPSSVRTSQAAKTSRIPLWQLLSQSSPSRSVNTPLPSTPLIPSVAATLSADSVTPLTTTTPPLPQSTSIEPPLALDEFHTSTLPPSPPNPESTLESTVPDASVLMSPLDNNDPDEILTKTTKTEAENVTLDSNKPPNSTPESTHLVDNPELVTDNEFHHNTTSQGSLVDTNFSLAVDPYTPVDNHSTVDVADNALDGIHPNTTQGNNTPENGTHHENAIHDNPVVDENDPLLTLDREENHSVFDPTEVLATSSPTMSVMWTPVVDVTESHTQEVSVVVSPSSALTSTTVVSPASPELLGGFIPIISSTHTTLAPHSEVVSGGSPTIPSPTSAAAPVGTTTTITASAPAQDFSTQPAPTPTLSASLEPTAVQKTDITDDPIPSLLPQPVQPEDGDEGTREEVPQKESAPEEVTPAPPPPPMTPDPGPPTPDITTPTTTVATTTTTTTTEAATTPKEQPTTVTPNITTKFVPPSLNETTAASGMAPSLTTTTVLENGTALLVELPYVRALVDYNSREFCEHKNDFRSMFAEWITRYLNGSVNVEPSDIKFFSMAKCPPTTPSRDDLSAGNGNGGNLGALPRQEENHTQVYFYVTRAGKADPELTEKFPLFPTDLVISEKLTYLLPRVRQLEVVRPDESSNQDQLQEATVGTSVIVIIVICSIVGVTIIVILFFFMVVKRRGAANNYYGRRCTPVSMDAYSMDSVSVYHSFRRKSKRRASGRSMKSYLNQAFDDPNGPSRPLNFAKLTHFISDIDGVHEEFATIPVNMPKYDELPPGVEDKNRYANVIPVPETRVLLKVTKDGRNCEYINANFVRGARNESKYYIATQAPLDDTVADFWRMIWEQETRVVVMLTDFVEKGIDKCADYLPPSETLDCHRLYGDFQVTLKSRDMRERFVVSNVQLKNLENNLVREVAHMWFTGWPASGVPNEEAAFISFILEVRRTRKKLRAKGPIVIHCSPGTGRTGTFLACDLVMKQFEEHRTIDVPRTVYTIRRDRAGAVQTKEQYAFIYRVINLYSSKLTSGNLESL